jgi:hypothetical protein
VSGPRVERLVQFRLGPHFDLDRQGARGAGAPDCGPHSSRRGDVVVLDQDGVE